MDFGGLSFDGLMGSDTNTANITTASGSGFDSLVSSDPETKQKWYGSGFLKQGRSGTNEDDWRSSKLCKTESMLLQQKMSTTSLPPPSSLSFFTRTDKGQKEPHMLSFSCPNSESFSVDRSFQNSSFPFLHLSSSAYNDGNTGYSSGNFNGGSMQLGAFTQSQWMELEHQALIYKYITANVPIPSNLLSPIRQAVESAARLSCFPASLLRPNTLAWGPFHLGYPGNTDPEPGRCRRTDGKKWRCSRDAVADQKYCERHMNRGRHRSRKPVEGQSGHSTAASATTANNAKLTTSSASAATMVVGTQGGSVSNSLPLQQQLQLKNFQTAGSNTSLSRTFLEKDNLVTANSLHSASNKSSSLMNGRNFGCAEGLTGPFRQFMDDWPNKSQSDCSVVSWPQLDLQSDRPQLSISIPMTTADYMSSTSSPNNETTTLSPLRLSHEFDPIQMGLGVGSGLNEPNQRQANWIPISWGTSMGGPLGEVLNNTSNNSSGECKNSSALNLMTEGWESSPRMESSPTGVLQKSTFRSLSNSSAGSSPRADNNKTTESASLCNALGSALVQQSAVPAL